MDYVIVCPGVSLPGLVPSSDFIAEGRIRCISSFHSFSLLPSLPPPFPPSLLPFILFCLFVCFVLNPTNGGDYLLCARLGILLWEDRINGTEYLGPGDTQGHPGGGGQPAIPSSAVIFVITSRAHRTFCGISYWRLWVLHLA